MEYLQWEALQLILSICGAISMAGGAVAVVTKLVHPALKLSRRVKKLEEYNSIYYRRLKAFEEMQKQQSKCLAAMLNLEITGNGIEDMKKIRDELLQSLIER